MLIPESGSKKGRFLKILAEIELDKPLLRGSKIKYAGQEVWVEFKYEHATFCFYCGKVGHFERDCSGRMRDAKTGQILEGQYGDWMRADQQRLGSRKTIYGGPDRAPQERARKYFSSRTITVEGTDQSIQALSNQLG